MAIDKQNHISLREKDANKPKAKSFENKYSQWAYILKKQYRKTKQIDAIGKVNYGLCCQYKVYPSAVALVSDVTDPSDIMFKIPAALLQTQTVEKLVPWLECQYPIEIGKEMMKVMHA